MGKPLDMKTIGMSCNLNDPWQKAIYDHVINQHNSALYLKLLVHMDMQGMETRPKRKERKETVKVDVSSFIN